MSGLLARSSDVFANAKTLATAFRTGQLGKDIRIALYALQGTMDESYGSTQETDLAAVIGGYNKASSQTVKDSLLTVIADILERETSEGLNAIIKETGTYLLTGTRRFADPKTLLAELAETIPTNNPLSLIPVRLQRVTQDNYHRLAREAERDYQAAVSKKLPTGQQWKLAGRFSGNMFNAAGGQFMIMDVESSMMLKGRVVAGLYIHPKRGIQIFAGTLESVESKESWSIRLSNGLTLQIPFSNSLRQFHYLDPK